MSTASVVTAPRKKGNALRIVTAIAVGLPGLLLTGLVGLVLLILGVFRAGDWIFDSSSDDMMIVQMLFIALLTGVALIATAALILLRPRRVKLALTEADAARDPLQSPKNTVNATVAKPGKTGDLPSLAVTPNGYEIASNKPVRIYHTRIMGTAFAEDGHGRGTLSASRVGDILILKTATRADGSRAVSVQTAAGGALGYMDTAIVQSIRRQYPAHRIGAVLERIEGGDGRPYVGYMAVTVYHTPDVAQSTEAGRGRRGR